MNSPLFEIFQERTPQGPVETSESFSYDTFRPKTEHDLRLRLARYLSYGNRTNLSADGRTQFLAGPDGLATFSPSHTCLHCGSKTFTNMSTNEAPISADEVLHGMYKVYENGLLNGVHHEPDTIITGADPEMVHWTQKMVIPELWGTYRLKLQHFIIPEINLDAKGQPTDANRFIWFVADVPNSRAHLRKLDGDKYEAGIRSPFWIYGSFAHNLNKN